MADTLNISINKTEGWTKLASSGVGFFSASKYCQYCLAQSTPDEHFYGHRLGTSDNINFTLSNSEFLYVKSDRDIIIVATGSDIVSNSVSIGELFDEVELFDELELHE